jgi:hypothetical protein
MLTAPAWICRPGGRPGLPRGGRGWLLFGGGPKGKGAFGDLVEQAGEVGFVDLP